MNTKPTFTLAALVSLVIGQQSLMSMSPLDLSEQMSTRSYNSRDLASAKGNVLSDEQIQAIENYQRLEAPIKELEGIQKQINIRNKIIGEQLPDRFKTRKLVQLIAESKSKDIQQAREIRDKLQLINLNELQGFDQLLSRIEKLKEFVQEFNLSNTSIKRCSRLPASLKAKANEKNNQFIEDTKAQMINDAQKVVQIELAAPQKPVLKAPKSCEELQSTLQVLEGVRRVENTSTQGSSTTLQAISNTKASIKEQNCTAEVADVTEEVADVTEEVADVTEEVADVTEKVADVTEEVADVTEEVSSDVTVTTGSGKIATEEDFQRLILSQAQKNQASSKPKTQVTSSLQDEIKCKDQEIKKLSTEIADKLKSHEEMVSSLKEEITNLKERKKEDEEENDESDDKEEKKYTLKEAINELRLSKYEDKKLPSIFGHMSSYFQPQFNLINSQFKLLSSRYDSLARELDYNRNLTSSLLSRYSRGQSSSVYGGGINSYYNSQFSNDYRLDRDVIRGSFNFINGEYNLTTAPRKYRAMDGVLQEYDIDLNRSPMFSRSVMNNNSFDISLT